MAPKKGGANKKGKQPAKRKATPQVSPPQSSSDEESWPIWKQLQEKISALEAEKMATQLRQDGDYQPRRSTRDSSGHRRAKLKALASDLMERFNVLEADRGTRRNEMTESAGESSVFKSRHLERISDVSLPATPANPEIPDGSEDIVGIPQDTEADSCPSTSMGLIEMPRRRRIMIMGHSYVHWAGRYAAESHWGSDLGLGTKAQLTWKGLRGMRWIQLCRLAAFGQAPPDILVIHLGGNDLAQHPGKALVLDILRDLRWLQSRYPVMRIVWSTIVPRLVWKDARVALEVNMARRNVNREVCRALCKGLGSVIGHHRIRFDRPELFRRDGIHLSDLGLDVFLEDIKGGLRAELERPIGGHGT
uniref:1-alkyl-2-acetylglycerophosphocholine esterase n=1 Tax=Pogona vitticeps TaxID=103695 RepID=A0ABM5FLU4_9SAUR